MIFTFDVHHNAGSRLRMLLFCLLLCGSLRADPPPDSSSKPGSDQPEKSEDVLISLKKMSEILTKLPQKGGEALLSLERLQALKKQIEQLQAQLNEKFRKAPITSCSLSVRAKGNSAEVELKLDLNLLTDEGAVDLGMGQSQPTEVRADKKLPTLLKRDGALIVLLQGKGAHQIIAKFDCPILELVPTDAQEQREGLTLSLPPAAYTLVSHLELPKESEAIKINGRSITLPLKKPVSLQTGEQLRINWRKRARSTKAQAVRTAHGSIDVFLDPQSVTTRALLTLTSQGQAVSQWRLQVPPGSQVKVLDDPEVSPASQKTKDGQITLERRKPSMAPLTIEVTTRQSRKSSFPSLGPFTVIDATSQMGTIRFHGTSSQWVTCASMAAGRSFHVSVARRQPTNKEKQQWKDLISVYNYTGQGLANDFTVARSTWLQPRLHTVQGRLDARVSYQLRLKVTARGKKMWHLTTRIDITPVQKGVEELTFTLPPPWNLDREIGPLPRELIQAVSAPDAKGQIRLQLTQSTLDPFTVWIEAFHELDQAIPNIGLLQEIPLPRPINTRSQASHEIKATVPSGFALSTDLLQTSDSEIRARSTHSLRWESRRIPSHVTFKIRPYQPPQRVEQILDVRRTEDRLIVRQELHFFGESTAPDLVVVLMPDEMEEVPRLLRGSSRSIPDRLKKNKRLLLFQPEASDPRKGILTFEHVLPLTLEQKSGLPITLPLMRAPGATHGQMRARFWADEAGELSLSRDSARRWRKTALEIVPSEQALPFQVIQTDGPDVPLSFQWRNAPDRRASALHVDRALCQVRVTESAIHQYQVRLRLLNWTRTEALVDIPKPALSGQFRVFLDDWEIVNWKLTQARSDGTARVSIPLPAPPSQASILMFHYTLSDGESSRFKTRLHPPQLVGTHSPFEVRWQIDLPRGQFPLSWSGNAGDLWTWGGRGWLPGPIPQLSAHDLKSWLIQKKSASTESGYPSLILQRSGLVPIQVIAVSEHSWLLVLSLSVLILGILICFVARARGRSKSSFRIPGVLFGTALVALVGMGMLWPGLFAVLVYGSLPGLAILLVILLVYRIWAHRAEKRLLMLPGFRRGNPGSQISRSEGRSSASGRKTPSSRDRQPQPTGLDAPAEEIIS